MRRSRVRSVRYASDGLQRSFVADDLERLSWRRPLFKVITVDPHGSETIFKLSPLTRLAGYVPASCWRVNEREVAERLYGGYT